MRLDIFEGTLSPQDEHRLSENPVILDSGTLVLRDKQLVFSEACRISKN